MCDRVPGMNQQSMNNDAFWHCPVSHLPRSLISVCLTSPFAEMEWTFFFNPFSHMFVYEVTVTTLQKVIYCKMQVIAINIYV